VTGGLLEISTHPLFIVNVLARSRESIHAIRSSIWGPCVAIMRCIEWIGRVRDGWERSGKDGSGWESGLVGEKDVVTTLEHAGGEVSHHRFRLNVQIAEHSV
jgi:hypothetical protein